MDGLVRLLRAFAGLVATVFVGVPAMLGLLFLTGTSSIDEFLSGPTSERERAVAWQMLGLPFIGSGVALVVLTVWLNSLQRMRGGVLLVFLIGLSVLVALSCSASALKFIQIIPLSAYSAVGGLIVALNGFGLLFVVLFWIALVSSSFAAWRTARDGRSKRAALELVPERASLLRYVLGVPQHLKLLKRRRRRATTLFVLRALVTAFGIFLFVNLTLLPAQVASILVQDGITEEAVSARLERSGSEATALLPFLVVGPLVLLFAGWLSIWLERRAQGLVLLTMQDALASDLRRPVVFLRSFLDDHVRLPKSWRMQSDRILEPGKRSDTLDDLVLNDGFAVGPVVALGRPGDPFPPYGAARGYFTQDSWQQAVTKVCTDAHSIVLCVDDSEAGGVWWELDFLATAGLLPKTLVLVHPRFRTPSENAAFLKRIGEMAPAFAATHPLPLLPPGSSVIALVFATDVVQPFTSSRFGDLAYRTLIRWHLGRTVDPVSAAT